MRHFHYFAPNSEEQRAFAIQFFGTLGGWILLAFFFWHTAEIGLRGVLMGCGLAMGFLLWRAAWELELKARRSQTQSIGVDASGLHFFEGENQTVIAWEQLQSEVRHGVLHLSYPHGQYQISAREIEDGMKLIGLIARRGKEENAPFVPSTNFIPLSPK